MTKPAAEYRALANELLMQARVEPNPDVKNTLYQIAQGYGHLAELVDKRPSEPIVIPPVEQIAGPEDSSEA